MSDLLIVSLSHRVPSSTAAATSKASVRHIVYLQHCHLSSWVTATLPKQELDGWVVDSEGGKTRQ